MCFDRYRGTAVPGSTPGKGAMTLKRSNVRTCGPDSSPLCWPRYDVWIWLRWLAAYVIIATVEAERQGRKAQWG